MTALLILGGVFCTLLALLMLCIMINTFVFILLIFFIGFVVGAFFFWRQLINNKIYKKREQETKEKGIEYVGNFVSSTANWIETGTTFQHYRITVSYQLASGETKTFKTKFKYSSKEESQLKQIKTFKIKVYNNFAMIVEDFKHIEKRLDKLKYEDDYQDEKIKCSYCGTCYDNSENKCPNCGASNQ